MEDVQTASNAVSDTAMPEANAVPSISDALSKAFDTVNQTTDTQETAQPSEGPARAPDGKFAAKASEAPADGQEQPAAPETPAVTATPPARFVKAAQEAWAQAPEIIRTEVARMEAELTNGMQKYKESAEAFEPLKAFNERAKREGTDLTQVLTAYTGFEDLVRAKPVQGMVSICNSLGIDPVQMGQALAGLQASGGDAPDVASLKAEIAALKQEISGVAGKYQEIELRPIQQQVEDFASKNPLFNYVADDIAKNIAAQKQAGQTPDLATAYQQALALHPHLAAVAAQTAAPAATTPTTPDPAQTRKASLSITGSPSVSNTSTRKPAGSTREALDSAFASVGLS